MNLVIDDDVRAIPAATFLMTHTTNPLLTTGTILKSISFYYKSLSLGHADSVFSVNKVQSRFYSADMTYKPRT